MFLSSRYQDCPKPKSSHAVFKVKKLRQKQKAARLNLGPKQHLMFDCDGNPIKPRPSKVIDKVQKFLEQIQTADPEPEPELTGQEPSAMSEVSPQMLDSSFGFDCSADDSGMQASLSDSMVFKEAQGTWDAYLSKKKEASEEGEADCGDIPDCIVESASMVDEEEIYNVSSQEDDGSTDVSFGMNASALNADIETFGIDTCGSTSLKMPQRQQSKSKKKKKHFGGKKPPAEISSDPVLWKYWAQRYRLFSLFDKGIKLDRGKILADCCAHRGFLTLQRVGFL
jgi:hypothetical protein